MSAAATLAEDLGGLARAVFDRELPRPATRHRLMTETFSEAVWEIAAGGGWFQALVPEAAGGMGGGAPELAALMVETGRALACGPWFETLVANRLRDRADLGGDGSVVTAATIGSPFAEHGDRAAWILILGDSIDLARIAGARPALRVDLASRPCRVEPDPAGRQTLLTGEAAAGFRQQVDALAAVANAARMLGVIEEVRDMSVAYAKERVQFDRPIGGFQAVQQRLADLAVLAAAARSALEAMLETEDPVERWALRALVVTSGRRAVESALQVHGGIGFTDEHRLHLYYKHALRLQAAAGSDGAQAIALGARLLDA